jgi:hypothetical protein
LGSCRQFPTSLMALFIDYEVIIEFTCNG